MKYLSLAFDGFFLIHAHDDMSEPLINFPNNEPFYEVSFITNDEHHINKSEALAASMLSSHSACTSRFCHPRSLPFY